jgi:oxygen-dependent protoporphyrinogen oxidase
VTRHVPALVVGGGISGLVCAYTLRKAGIDAELIEASSRPGGVIQSFTRDGFLLELGPQSFSGTPALGQLCDELGISDQVVQAPSRSPRYVLVAGRLQPVPLSPPAFLTSGLIGGATKWALLRDIFGNTVPPEPDESVAAFVRRKFSAQLLDRLVGPFVSGVYAGDPERLSVRSAFPQLYEAEKTSGSIVRGMIRLAKSRRGPRENQTLQSFCNGNEILVTALSNNLGPAIRTQLRGIGISRRADGAFDVRLKGEGNLQPVSAKALIFAAPTDVTGSLLGQLRAAFEPLLATVEYASVAVVSLGYRKSDVGHALDGFGFLVPRSAGLRVLGTVWNSFLFPGRAPQGRELITSFVGGTTDPGAAILKPEELATLVHRETSPLLSIKSEPIFSNVQIWPRALPQYNLGHAERLAVISKLLQDFPGIWLAGNYLRGPAVGACIEQAVTVAEEVRKGLDS